MDQNGIKSSIATKNSLWSLIGLSNQRFFSNKMSKKIDAVLGHEKHPPYFSFVIKVVLIGN